LVAITCRLWEEANAVPLANNDKGNFGLNTQFFACTYGGFFFGITQDKEKMGILRMSGTSFWRTAANCPSDTPPKRNVCGQHGDGIEPLTVIE
jgi:hypothetical protein